jgi:uncharacterized protein
VNNSTNNYTLSEIWIYPVKSLSGFQVNEAIVEERGLKFDRRWLIIDENNRFLTQREFQEMALIQVSLDVENDELKSMKFSHKTKNGVEYILQNPLNVQTAKIEVQIWDDVVEACEIYDEINNWLSTTLNTKCRLVYMPDSTERKVDGKYAVTGNEITSFSDAYPFLIAGNEALKLLNSKIEVPITMNRFRPNFVFDGGEAHDEDFWQKFKISNVEFFGVKKCARCPIPTIDQETGIMAKEPLKSLAKYRFANNKVYFGQNLLPNSFGKVKVGDGIEVLLKGTI